VVLPVRIVPLTWPLSSCLLRTAWVAFAVGLFIATDLESVRTWLSLTLLGSLPIAVMFLYSHAGRTKEGAVFGPLLATANRAGSSR
jgi:multisubunit Na+/H+ antiporter MnhC subunit